jgi:hypothetical protein
LLWRRRKSALKLGLRRNRHEHSPRGCQQKQAQSPHPLHAAVFQVNFGKFKPSMRSLGATMTGVKRWKIRNHVPAHPFCDILATIPGT